MNTLLSNALCINTKKCIYLTKCNQLQNTNTFHTNLTPQPLPTHTHTKKTPSPSTEGIPLFFFQRRNVIFWILGATFGFHSFWLRLELKGVVHQGPATIHLLIRWWWWRYVKVVVTGWKAWKGLWWWLRWRNLCIWWVKWGSRGWYGMGWGEVCNGLEIGGCFYWKWMDDKIWIWNTRDV